MSERMRCPNCNNQWADVADDGQVTCGYCGFNGRLLLPTPEQPTDEITTILKERGARYGDFPGHALITQNIKAAMVASPNWAALPAPLKESLEMVAHKIGRILNGDPFHEDSWVDIQGYTRLGLEFVEMHNDKA